MSFSAVVRSAVAAVLALQSGAPATPAPATPAPSSVARTAVTLLLSIDAPAYRSRLQDGNCTQRCLQLRNALADTVRSMLQQSYAFFDWRSGAAVSDTFELRWVDGEAAADIPNTKLEFGIRSRTGAPPRMTNRFPVPFESYSDFSARISPERWHPDSLRRAWVVRLADKLRQPDLLVEVFGRVPIAATVTFPQPGRATVSVRPNEIGATPDARPAFQVFARITDPAKGIADDAKLTVAKCQPLMTGEGYGCDVRQLQYTTQPPEPLDSTVALMRRWDARVKSVHVVEYAMPGRPSRFNGAVLPPELP